MANAATIEEPHDHVVDFYERDGELAARVSAYLSGGLDGEVAVVIATDEHRALIASHLEASGTDVEAAKAAGLLIELDAAALLDRFCSNGTVDPIEFDRHVGALIRAQRLAPGIRAYGEMVQLLWGRGEVVAAVALESLWNELGRDEAFHLYCGYRADGLAEYPQALGEIRQLHSDVVSGTPEIGESPLQAANFPASLHSPGRARSFARSVLEEWHLEHITDAVVLVVSELGTNAVVHAASPFSVSLARQGSVVRIAVRDGDRSMPRSREPSSDSGGRGMTIVQNLARDWGFEPEAEGKSVWAEIPI